MFDVYCTSLTSQKHKSLHPIMIESCQFTQLSLNKWDAKFSLFFLQKLVDSRYLLEENTAIDAFDHLRSHAALFIEQAAVSSSKPELSCEEEKNLERLWARLLIHHEQKRWPTCILASPKIMAALKVSLASIGAYIMFKTKCRHKDLDFALDIFALLLTALIECLSERMFDDARTLFILAENHILQRMNDENIYHSKGDPTEDQVVNFNRCSAELFWSRIFIRYENKKYAEIIDLLQSMKENAVELEQHHNEGLSQICHNISLEIVENQGFQDAIAWLKFTYTFAKKSYNAEDCLENALSILASCYLGLDCMNNSAQVLEILDLAEMSAVNMELRFQAMVAASFDSHLIAEHAVKYFKIKHEETGDSNLLKQSASQVFSVLEAAGQHSTIAHLMELIPWSKTHFIQKEIETSEGWVNQIRHLCAKYAARTCLSNGDKSKFFEILSEVSTWEFQNDDESILELAAEAEKIAVELHNEKRDFDACLRWYDVIIKFVNHCEIDWMVVWNAMACALDLAHPSGSQKARQLSHLIPQFDDWSDPFQLRLRLKLALLERSYEDANKIIFEIEDNKTEADWTTIEKVIASVAATFKSSPGPLLDWLEKISKHSTMLTLKAILLRFVLRFQMELLRNEARKDGDSKEYLLNKILNTLHRAYDCTRDALSDNVLLTEIRAWFARTAWNLGRLGGKSSAYFRHHLFKFSYLLFATEVDKSKMALIQAVQAALDAECKRITHVRLLQSSLGLIKDYDRSVPLLKAMQFHALCLLKDWRSAEQLADECCFSSEYDADFFESLSSIAIATKRSRISEIDAEGRIFTRPRAPPREQTRLTTVAAKCLRKALDLSTPRGISCTSVYCRWIVALLFERDSLPLPTSQFELLDGLAELICSPDYPFAEIRWIFTRVWNVTLLCRDRGFKRRILRWLERCQKLSPHSDRLMNLFGQQFVLAA